MLTTKVWVRHQNEATSPEDILSSALSLFPDETCNQHGDPDATIVYRSACVGDIFLTIADPTNEESRRLFAHNLWNAGICLAELISEQEGLGRWRVKGEMVLELGSGNQSSQMRQWSELDSFIS